MNLSIPHIYQSPSDKPQQGDIIISNIINYTELSASIDEEFAKNLLGIAILSNSCDVQHGINYVSFAPIFSLNFVKNKIVEEKLKSLVDKKVSDEKEIQAKIKKAIDDNIDNIATYKNKKYFYLPIKNPYIKEEAVIALEIGFTVEISECFNVFETDRKLSLNHPWREMLGYKVANLYNRIALKDQPVEYIEAMQKKYEYVPPIPDRKLFDK